MNNKESLLEQILCAVVGVCSTRVDELGTMSITNEDVLGKCRKDNVVMTRCMVANQLRRAGFTFDTIGLFLNRTPQDVRKLCMKEGDFIAHSCAYCAAFSQATLRCNKIMSDILSADIV